MAMMLYANRSMSPWNKSAMGANAYTHISTNRAVAPHFSMLSDATDPANASTPATHTSNAHTGVYQASYARSNDGGSVAYTAAPMRVNRTYFTDSNQAGMRISARSLPATGYPFTNTDFNRWNVRSGFAAISALNLSNRGR